MRRLRDFRPRLRLSRLNLAAAASLLVAIGIAVWLYAPSPTVAEKAAVLPRPNPAVVSSGSTTLGPTPEPESAEVQAARKAAGGSRLVIASLGLDVGVFGGDSARALKLGVYHHAGTANPGEPGNVVFAGHRNRRAFSALHQLKVGDTVSVVWRGKTHDYRVSKLLTVGPDDTWILRQPGAERLTLYTCLPRTVGNKRTVVVALPVAQ